MDDEGLTILWGRRRSSREARRGSRKSRASGLSQISSRARVVCKTGHAEAARSLADELVWSRPEEAYKWYYIGLSQQGYSVGWHDENHSPPYYCGPVGDFRNVAMVSDLVVSLGWERVRQLDEEAAQWMAANGIAPRPWRETR